MGFIENFNVARFLFSLQFMWKGMLAIFIVICVIVLSIFIMNKLGARKENKEETNE